MGKLRHRGTQPLARGDTGSQQQSWDLNPGIEAQGPLSRPVHAAAFPEVITQARRGGFWLETHRMGRACAGRAAQGGPDQPHWVNRPLKAGSTGVTGGDHTTYHLPSTRTHWVLTQP